MFVFYSPSNVCAWVRNISGERCGHSRSESDNNFHLLLAAMWLLFVGEPRENTIRADIGSPSIVVRSLTTDHTSSCALTQSAQYYCRWRSHNTPDTKKKIKQIRNTLCYTIQQHVIINTSRSLHTSIYTVKWIWKWNKKKSNAVCFYGQHLKLTFGSHHRGQLLFGALLTNTTRFSSLLLLLILLFVSSIFFLFLLVCVFPLNFMLLFVVVGYDCVWHTETKEFLIPICRYILFCFYWIN